MGGQVPETRDELEGRAPDDPENRSHLRIWEALLFLAAGVFLLIEPHGKHDVWSVLRGGGLTVVGLTSLLARAAWLPMRLGNATPLIALAGLLAWLTGALAWLIQKVL